MAPLTPLKSDDCHVLNGVIDSCNQTADLIAKCKACGMPVEDYEATNNGQKQYPEEVKRQFFPNNP